MDPTRRTISQLRLLWDTSDAGHRNFVLLSIDSEGEAQLIATTEQGPFDTALEIAQWAWKHMARVIPPSAC